MKRTFVLGTCLAALALAGCGHKTNSDASPGSSPSGLSANESDGNASAPGDTNQAAASVALPAGQSFANQAAASDDFEIATSKLALDKASKPAVKKFAKQMIDAHTGSTAKLKSVASGLSPALTPDPTLSAEQQQVLTDLQAKSGTEFDSAYKAAQVDGHQKTLDALKGYGASGDVPALKTFATGLVPTVTAHLNMAKNL
jgi:putative membrane protein